MSGAVADYTTRITELAAELKTKTLSEAEKERGLNHLNYEGVGYGYNLKDKYPSTMKQAKRDADTSSFEKTFRSETAQ